MSLMLRFYLFLVLSLIAYVGISDYLFKQQHHEQSEYQIAWLTAEQLALGADIKQLSEQLNIKLSQLTLESIDAQLFVDDVLLTQSENAQQLFYRHDDFILRLEFAKAPSNWPTSLFYLAMLVIVALWFWPLLRDVKLLNQAISKTGDDLLQPLAIDGVRQLKPTAKRLEQMREKIRQLIDDQKILTSGLSHEMRTPLARMKFSLALMSEANEAEKQSLVEDINELEALIDAMLQYARFDQQLSLQTQQANLHALATQVINKANINNSQIQLDIATDINVQVDVANFSLALSNLIVNACRHCQQQVLIRAQTSAQQLCISIEDDGSGIEKSDRNKVFTAFTRLDSSRNKKTGGYGLGLAIVKRIIDKHQFEISVHESELGGAKFVVEMAY